MSFGILWASQWLQRAFAGCIQRNAAAESETLTFELSRRLADRSPKTLAPGTKGWRELQEICETTRVPHNGFVSIIHRSTGALIWHSELKDNPGLLRSFPGRSALVTRAGVMPLLEGARRSELGAKRPIVGEVEIQGDLFRAACLSLPRWDAVIVVYMSQASLDASVAELVTPVLQAGFVLTAAVVGATTLLTLLLVTKFDNSLHTLSASVEQEVDRRTLALTRSRSALALGLAKLAESRDKDAGQHLERIRTYVTILATELAKQNSEIDHHYVANLASASALHDIGKIGVPDSVILKLGRLTSAERRAMQMHTVLGGECLTNVAQFLGAADQFIELGRQIAAAHHEQWDGSGYPQGLQGKAIPLAARIVALADVYDALTTRRAYRDAVSHLEAREWIISNYGAQFDPEVVEAFVAREQDFAKISLAANEQRIAGETAAPSAASGHGVGAVGTPDSARSAV
ncbi:MAG: HD domain-containing protein [Pirellulales bacterium]|nr:HD domain-containing protein [Pirellulales bacterium]